MTTLDHLITSRTLSKLIYHFCNYHKPMSIREIARLMQEDTGSTYKMIKRLEKAGIVKIENNGYRKTYVPVDGYALECLRYLHTK